MVNFTKIVVRHDDNRNFIPTIQGKNGNPIMHTIFVTLLTPKELVDKFVNLEKQNNFIRTIQIPNIQRESNSNRRGIGNFGGSDMKTDYIVKTITNNVNKIFENMKKAFNTPNNIIDLGLDEDGLETIQIESLIEIDSLGLIGNEFMTIGGFWDNIIFCMSSIGGFKDPLRRKMFLKADYFNNFLKILLVIAVKNNFGIQGKDLWYKGEIKSESAKYIIEQLPDYIEDKYHNKQLKRKINGNLEVRPGVMLVVSILNYLFAFVDPSVRSDATTIKDILDMLYRDIYKYKDDGDSNSKWSLFLPITLYPAIDMYNKVKPKRRENKITRKTKGILFISTLLGKLRKNAINMSKYDIIDKDTSVQIFIDKLINNRGKFEPTYLNYLSYSIAKNKLSNINNIKVIDLFINAYNDSDDIFKRVLDRVSTPFITNTVKRKLKNEGKYDFTTLENFFGKIKKEVILIDQLSRKKKKGEPFIKSYNLQSTLNILSDTLEPVLEILKHLITAEEMKIKIQYEDTSMIRGVMSEML